MSEEAYREIRLDRQKGLCDRKGEPLNPRQLETLAILARHQIKLQLGLNEIERWFNEEKSL